MGMIKFLTGFAFVAIFAIAIISYSLGFAVDNNAAVSISQDTGLNAVSATAKSGLSDFKTSSDTSTDILFGSSIASGDDNVEGGGQFKTGPLDIISTLTGIVRSANKTLFGEGNEFAVIFTTILTFIGFISSLYIWKAWKGGSPD